MRESVRLSELTELELLSLVASLEDAGGYRFPLELLESVHTLDELHHWHEVKKSQDAANHS